MQRYEKARTIQNKKGSIVPKFKKMCTFASIITYSMLMLRYISALITAADADGNGGLRSLWRGMIGVLPPPICLA